MPDEDEIFKVTSLRKWFAKTHERDFVYAGIYVDLSVLCPSVVRIFF